MFNEAIAFNQDLSAWDVSNAIEHTDFSKLWGGGTEPTWPE
jgi:surface protein